jgi:hypothetical protein
MYLLYLLSMVYSVDTQVSELNPGFLDGISGMWVAPDYEFVEDLRINPRDYGIPSTTQYNTMNTFFIDTPEGEKWRIVLTFPDRVVILQEGEEAAIYPIDNTSIYSICSNSGQWVLVLVEGPNTSSFFPPYNAVLIDLDHGNTQNTLNMYQATWIGNGGQIITFDDDSLRFYDENHFKVGSQPNWQGYTSQRPFSYAMDGSLLIERIPTYDVGVPCSYALRAYNASGDSVWQTPIDGNPTISYDSKSILVTRTDGFIACLDAAGRVLFTDSLPYPIGPYVASSRSDNYWAASVRYSNICHEGLYTYPRVNLMGAFPDACDQTILLYGISYSTSCLGNAIPRAVGSDGSTLWVSTIDRDILHVQHLLTSSNGDPIFVYEYNYATETIEEGELISHSFDYARESVGNGRVMFYYGHEIHILTVDEV